MAYKEVDDVIIEEARLLYRNFSGKEQQYNKPGERNFCVVIEDPDMAEKMAEDGWNVKIRVPRDPDEDPVHYIKVKVSYDRNPPKVRMVVGRKIRFLTKDTINNLDTADFKKVDIVINPYCWNQNGSSGITGYLKEGYFTIEEDVFADKYADYEYPEEDYIPDEEVPF